MNIWIVTIGEFLPNERANLKGRSVMLAEALLNRGNSIVFFASSFNHFLKKWSYRADTCLKITDRYILIAFKGKGYKKNISVGRFLDHRIIAGKFRKISVASEMNSVEIPKPDIIVVSTPPYDLAYNAVRYAKANNIPVIVDIRDEWPDLFVQRLPNPLKYIAKGCLYYEFYMLKYALRNATCLVSMMNSLLEWGLKNACREKINTDTVFYLGGSKVNPATDVNNSLIKRSNIPSGKFIVVFIGTFVLHNHPAILIECAKRLQKENHIHFVLAGDGPYYRKLVESANGYSNITFTGWLQENEMADLIKLASVGTCLSPFARPAFPNKVFSYLSFGLPVISSFQGELKDLMEKKQFGFYFPPGDVAALAECILKLYKSPALHRSYSENAKMVFEEMFDAEKIYEQYALYVERIAKNFGLPNEPS